ncbi:hypothetical protein [Christiangramia crocea]|uniref:Uncharacterized protein n=1 Tax=Christiangramia crocea TaxID=2904124 RepID=A0A9X1UVD2_9FLAO|nr:hypothetical protein [Gramella crocea]MCG9971019.1 hypothetical protein [Gramella crocea]
MKTIKIKKLKEAESPLHPNNIEEGFEKIGQIPDNYFRYPTVGERFWISLSWSTSGVQEIIDENTFKTYNSIYHWEIISLNPIG